MGGGDSKPPQYVQQPPAPDPYKTAEAQTGYNIDSAIASALLSNTNQSTPYGDITYTKTGEQTVGGKPAVAAVAPTGGYWNGFAWVPTGGSAAVAATPGYRIPTYTAKTTLSPLLQSLVDQSIYNARGVGGLETNLISQLQNAKYPAPLDLSWGAKQANIWGLERQSIDPYWKQQEDIKNQQLADQGLTPGSQGWGYEQTQFARGKGAAYTDAMLAAQDTAARDMQAEYNAKVNQYNDQYNVLNALKTGAQIVQPGVGQLAPTSQQNVAAPNYTGVVTSNYANQANMFNNYQNALQDYNKSQNQQNSDLMGGLFGFGGKLLGAIPALIGSDRRDKTDIKRLGIEPQTKLPLYSYRYKDDPKTYPKVVGPMAQDIEKVYPEAIGEVEGHKVVFGLGGM